MGDKMGMEALEAGERPKLQEMLWDFWKEKTGHSADCVLITVVGLPRSSGGARNRQAKKARKSATILTMSTHGWSLTHLKESFPLLGPNTQHTKPGWLRQNIKQWTQESSLKIRCIFPHLDLVGCIDNGISNRASQDDDTR